jgi:molybdopterin biosynthesis enzyme
MANTFKNYVSANVGTSAVTTYTVPSVTTSVMIGCNLANTTTSQIKLTVQVAGVYLIRNVPLPSGAAISVLDGKIILETTDTVIVTSDTATSCDVVVSVLEQT